MASTNWLERLNSATEYRDLQLVFSELAAEARRTSDGSGLARCIDEAIHRIERERLRDEDELRAFEQEYTAFKEQQSGVVGWFKRHLPFTETRRLEKQHQHTVADRRAEVLADNLIIARAQMVKEQLLSPDRRRMGHEPAAWRQRLADSDSLGRLQDYAAAVVELGDELSQSRAFVREVDADIEAFREARFSDEEDRRRKDADLSAARSELASLKAEIQSEESLRGAAVKRLGELVQQELAEREPSFRALGERLDRLEAASRRAKEAEQALDQVHAGIKALRDVSAQLDGLPAERDKLARRASQLRAEAEDAARRRVHAATHLGEHRARCEVAKAASGRAAAAVDTARKAYQARFGNRAEVDPAESAQESAAAEDVARAQRALDQAEAELRVASAAHDTAKGEADRVEREAEKLRKELDEVRGQEEKVSERERRLHGELGAARDRLRPAFERVDPLIASFLAAIEPLGRNSSLREAAANSPWRHELGHQRGPFSPPRAFPQPEPQVDWQASQARHERLLQAIRDDLAGLTRELAEARKQLQDAWASRCRTLLGESLAAEVCQGS
jgi:hypothetical protein